jgi:hypothetical protein
VTSVTDTIGVRKVSVALPDTPNQEGIMSSLHLYDTTKSRAALKHHDYGFVLALICLALALVVASAIFTPAPAGTGIDDQIWFVGP